MKLFIYVIGSRELQYIINEELCYISNYTRNVITGLTLTGNDYKL